MGPQRAITKEKDFHLRLYIADDTPRSVNAVANLKKICKESLKGKCHVEIIDIIKSPDAARRDQIVTIPTLLSKAPKSLRQAKRIIGNLSDTSKVLSALRF